MELKTLICPQCHSASVQRAADGTFRCGNCHTRLLMADSLGQLVIPDVVSGWIDCPKCGAVNEADHLFCSQCGTEIRYKCPNCGTVRRASEPICGECGQTYHSTRTFSAHKQQRKRRRLRSLIAGGVAMGFMWAIWMIIVASFDWRNNETIDAIANTVCCMSPFIGLAVAALAYVLQRSLGNMESI